MAETPDGTVARYRTALEKIAAKNTGEGWLPDVPYPTEYSRAWHDGYRTCAANNNLIAQEALDPTEYAEFREMWEASSQENDRQWFERTGNCGHCGNYAGDCDCTADDPCGCGPHDRRTVPVECRICRGTGLRHPPSVHRDQTVIPPVIPLQAPDGGLLRAGDTITYNHTIEMGPDT